jgi:hypothetical protein
MIMIETGATKPEREMFRLREAGCAAILRFFGQNKLVDLGVLGTRSRRAACHSLLIVFGADNHHSGSNSEVGGRLLVVRVFRRAGERADVALSRRRQARRRD